MRRTFLSISLLVIAALALAACSGSPSVAGTPVGGTAVKESTPAAVSTLPAATETTAATAAAPTVAATSAPTEAATVESTATVEPTSAAGAGTTPTATAGGTGGTTSQANFLRLTSLLTAKVNGSDTTAAGQVDGVLIEHPAIPVTAEAAATPEATPTPTTAMENAVQDFTIRYVLVDTSSAAGGTAPKTGSGKIVVVPWQAFNFASTQADGTLTLNTSASVVANAPHVTLADVAGGSTKWNTDMASYWSGQNIAGIPATGTSNATLNLALLPREFRGITLNDKQGAQIASIADFVIDPQTGKIIDAVFNGGETFGNQELVVPLTHLTWNGVAGMQIGSFQLNFPSDVLKNVPPLPSNLQIDQAWLDQLNQFWNSIKLK